MKSSSLNSMFIDFNAFFASCERVSPALTCSIGIAPNKFLAKTASDRQKPDGLVVIRPEDPPKVLHSLDWSDEIRFNPTQDVLELLRTLEILWARRRMGRHSTPLAVGVNFLELNDEANAVRSLFEHAQTDRRRALLAAVDHLNVTGGENTAYFAGAHGAVDYTPMRIAFNRPPDPDTERQGAHETAPGFRALLAILP